MIKLLGATSAVVIGLFWGAAAYGDVLDSTSSAWLSACEGDVDTTARVGVVEGAEVSQGLDMLRLAGFTTTLRNQSLTEACLSILATATVEAPVLVVSKPNTFREMKLYDFDIDDYLASNQSANDFARRLEALGVGYTIHPKDDATKALVADWRKENRVSRLAASQKARTSERSYAAPMKDHCLVVTAGDEFHQWFDRSTKKVQESVPEWLPRTTVEWQRHYGDAAEFWHEVGHCTQGPGYVAARDWLQDLRMQESGRQIDVTDFRVPAVGRNQTEANGNACSAAPPNRQSLSDTTNELLAIGKSGRVEEGQDAGLLITMNREFYADQFSQWIMRDRFGLSAPGCTSTATSITPWERTRLLLTLSNPTPGYLTLAAPYLAEASLQGQRHALSEVWDAVVEISHERDTQSVASQLRRDVRNRYFATPTLAPERTRQQVWKRWILSRLATTDLGNGVGFQVRAEPESGMSEGEAQATR